MGGQEQEHLASASKSAENLRHEMLLDRIALLHTWIDEATTPEEVAIYQVTLDHLNQEAGIVTPATSDQKLTDADGVPLWEKT